MCSSKMKKSVRVKSNELLVMKHRQQTPDSSPLQAPNTASSPRKNPTHMHFLEYFYLKEDKKETFRRNLEKILEKKEKSIKVDDVDVQPACSAGENFAAEVYRVVVYGRRLCLGAWTDIRKSLIVKQLLDPSSPCHGWFNSSQLFKNEIVAYEFILPMYQRYLDKKNEINEMCFPKYYGQCQCFLVLQDLRTEGYQQVNRLKGFSVRECSLVLRELSRIHALSIALSKDEETSFMKNIEKLKEAILLEEFDVTSLVWENTAKFAIRSLRESGNPKFEKAIETLNFYSGRILKTVVQLIRPDFTKFDVLCHGDLWSNNILLRYCDSGYPIGVKLIDLQAMRYCSCVLDIMHVLFTSSRPVIYERYLDLLLSEYYNSLVANLKNLDAPANFTYDEFLAEFKRKIVFGMFIACIMLTCVTRTSPPDPSEVKLTADDLSSESQLDKMYSELGPGYHERLRALFLALTDSNLI